MSTDAYDGVLARLILVRLFTIVVLPFTTQLALLFTDAIERIALRLLGGPPPRPRPRRPG